MDLWDWFRLGRVSSPINAENLKATKEMDLPLHLALVLMGFSFIITQVVVIRELLVVFMGNELSIAIILANWLLWGALGSYLAGRKAEDFRCRREAFALGQGLQALFFPITILVIRLLREIMGLSPGEGASLGQIFSLTFPLLAPLGTAAGAMFSLGCALYERPQGKMGFSAGRVYLIEAIGAVLGGGTYTFFLIPGFHSFQIAYILGAAACLSGALLMLGQKRRPGWMSRILAGSLIVLLASHLLLLVVPKTLDLESLSLKRQWPGFSLLEVAWSPYGNIAVSQRQEQLTIFSNGLPVLTAPIPDIAQIEELVHFPMLFHHAPEKILVIGGGLGGVLSEVLKHPVREIHHVEPDPLMIDLIRRNATPLTRSEIENPKVRHQAMDGRFFIKKATADFDLVLMNLPGPFTLQLNRFYTAEFFQEVSRILRPRGILAFSLPGAEAYLSKEARDLNLSLLESLKAVFPSVWLIPGNFNLILASVAADEGAPSAARFIKRLEEKGIPTQFLTGFHIERKMDPARKAWMEESFGRWKRAKANLDSQPSGLYYGLAYWNAEFHPAFQKFWGWLDRVPVSALLFVCFLLIGAGVGLSWKWAGKAVKAILVGVMATTGFFGMAMSIVVIFSFQTLYGHIYQWIGILIAAFMAGLAWGSWWMTRRNMAPGNLWPTLRGVELAMVFLTALGTALLLGFYFFPMGLHGVFFMPVVFLIWSGLAGFLVGFEFPLANALWAQKGEGVVKGAGTLYGADLMGAWSGSLVVGVILMPVFGLWPTLGILLLLKGGSWLWVRLQG